MAFLPHPRVETPTMPIEPGAKTCFDNIICTKETTTVSVQLGNTIRFFDDYTRHIREQLENKDDDGSGRKIFHPRGVAIGPRFHGEEDLKRGEEIKRMAAWEFWENSHQPFTVLYGKVQAVASEAWASYANASSFTFTHEEFTAMMFVDGCFLLQLIVFYNEICVDGGQLSGGSDFSLAYDQIGSTTLLADIFVVENQIPWVVLRELMSIRPVQVMFFIDIRVAISFDKQSARPSDQDRHELAIAGDYGPIHLLDLLCKRQLGGQASALTPDQIVTYSQLEVVTLTSATELAEAGVNIRPSRTPRFADIHFWWRWPVFGRLSLPPLILRRSTVALLLNMLAFELFYWDSANNSVCAYFGMLSALISREEDVRELRRKGIIQTTLSDKEVMKIFKKLEPHANSKTTFDETVLLRAKINHFFKRQWMWITVHRFVYNNLRFLVAIASFLSVSLSILKAILSLPGGSSNN